VFHGIVRRSPAPRVQASRTRSVLWLASACCAVALLAAGCGSSSGSANASGSASPSTASFSAYRACLSQHGVKIPARPTARPTAHPTARPTGFASLSAAMRKAMTACASLRPKSFAAGGARFEAAFKAFRTCMSSHGVTIPTTRPTARPTPTGTPSPGATPNPDRFLNGLNPKNAKVAAALKACDSKLPKFGAGGGGGAGS
jgi:hypothetical protein